MKALSDPAFLALALLIVAGLLVADEYILNLMIISLFFGVQAMVFDFTSVSRLFSVWARTSRRFRRSGWV
jgi:hypothetical protein